MSGKPVVFRTLVPIRKKDVPTLSVNLHQYGFDATQFQTCAPDNCVPTAGDAPKNKKGTRSINTVG